MALHFSKVAVGFTVKVSQQLIENHLAASPFVVGEELAQQVHAYAVTHNLGYYPALEFFEQQGELDPDLLNAAENIAWLVTGLVREEVRTHLRPVFSSLKFETIKAVLFTMPTVRPGQTNDVHQLAQHFMPDQVKVSLIATSIRKQENPEVALSLTRNMVCRRLRDHFTRLDINSFRYIEE